MSNAKQETIADIVAKMLEFAETDSQSIGRDVLRRRIQHFARRFEAAWKREREATRESELACPCDEDVHGVVFDIDVTDRIVKALRGNKGEE